MEGLLFPRWKGDPELDQAVAVMMDLAAQHARLAGSKVNEDRVQAQKLWTKLSGSYWEVLFALLDAQTKKLPPQLAFDERERLFIYFGYPVGVLPTHRDFDPAAALSSRCGEGVLPCMAFSDYIAECWAMILGKEPPTPVIGLPLRQRMAGLAEKLNKAQFTRDDMLTDIAEEYVKNPSLDLRQMTTDLNRCLMAALKVSMRAPEYREADEAARKTMAQDRHRYLEAERAMELMLSSAQKNEENPLPLPTAERVLQLHERAKVTAKKIIYCQGDVKKIARRAKKITDACASMSAQMRRKELRNMLLKKKEYLTVPAKTARRDTSLFCQTDCAPIDYQVNAAKLEDMCGLDMDMFAVPRVRMYGIPRAIFAPGQGLGTYDWQDHSLIIPVFAGGDEDKSLAYALGSFRWDSDEDRVLKNPYEQIKENRKKSILEMATSFYKDYALWLTKEKRGYRILPRTTHKVFVQMFAPRPEE